MTCKAVGKRRRVFTSYLAVFPTEHDAAAAAEELGESGMHVEFGYDIDDMEWCLSFRRPGLADAEIEGIITGAAARHGGYFDRNLVGPFI